MPRKRGLMVVCPAQIVCLGVHKHARKDKMGRGEIISLSAASVLDV